MKLIPGILYFLIVSSLLLASCEKQVPDTINPDLATADGIIKEYVAVQSEINEILNIAADVLIQHKKTIDEVASKPIADPTPITYDDCNASVLVRKIVGDSIEIKVAYKDLGCRNSVSQKVRQDTLTIKQAGNLGYLVAGHQMFVNFKAFQIGTRILSGKLSVKNVSKSAGFTVTDTLKQQIVLQGINLNNAGTIIKLTTGYHERGLVSGLVSRSMGDDVYWADTTHYTMEGNSGSYIVTHNKTANSSLRFDYRCLRNQVFHPSQGNIQVLFNIPNRDSAKDTADVDFGNGTCDPFKKITVK